MLINIDQIDHLEKLTQLGKTSEIKDFFNKIKFSKIPRKYREPLATIARRNNLMIINLKILNPIVRSEKVLDMPATDNELLSYASGLSFLGLVKEAKGVILKVKNINLPERNLQLAFVYLNLWDHKSAGPLIKKFITMQPKNSYSHIVGLVNLAACYISDNQLVKAENILNNVFNLTSDNSYNLLRGNAFELKAQLNFRNNDFTNALKNSQIAKSLFPDKGSLYLLFAEKWEALAQLMLNPQNLISVENVQKIKLKAKEMRHWETIRDCDLYLAISCSNKYLIEKVYFGTPLLTFKNKIITLWKKKIDNKNSIEIFNEKSILSIQVFELLSAHDFLRRIEKNRFAKKFLFFLFTDFYKPKSLGEIFSHLYGDQFFDPIHSTKRVLNHFLFLKKQIKIFQIPIELSHVGNDFFWIPKDNFKIRVPLNFKSDDIEVFVNKLKLKFKGKSFSSLQVVSLLQISKTKAIKLLTLSINKKQIKVRGQGRARRYHF